MVNIAKVSIYSKTLVKCHQSKNSSSTCSLYSKDYLKYKLWSSHKYLCCVTDGTKVTEEGTTEEVMAQEKILNFFLHLNAFSNYFWY